MVLLVTRELVHHPTMRSHDMSSSLRDDVDPETTALVGRMCFSFLHSTWMILMTTTH